MYSIGKRYLLTIFQIPAKYVKKGNRMNPDKKVRRMQGLLYTSGAGTVLFSIWSGIRGLENLFEFWKVLFQDYGTETFPTTLKIFLCTVIFLTLMLITFLHLYIGKTAMDVSNGKNRSNLYLVLAALYNILSWTLYIPQLSTGELFEIKTIIYFIIDLSSNIILIEVIIFSLLLKRYKMR